ncbi:hypothetical protein HF319_00090 [Xanthomonas sp. Kuri4-1]
MTAPGAPPSGARTNPFRFSPQSPQSPRGLRQNPLQPEDASPLAVSVLRRRRNTSQPAHFRSLMAASWMSAQGATGRAHIDRDDASGVLACTVRSTRDIAHTASTLHFDGAGLTERHDAHWVTACSTGR